MLALLSFVSLGLSAAAAVISKRADIPCVTVHTGTLRLFSVNQETAPLDPNGVNISFIGTGATPDLVVTGGSATQFEFMQCNSSYMDYDEYDGPPILNYGHILPQGQPKPIGGDVGCLTVPLGSSSGSPFLIFNDACTEADGEEQLEMFWELVNDTQEGKVTVNFIGITLNGTTYDNDGYGAWGYEIDEYEGASALKLAGYLGPTPINYELRFVD